MSNAVKTPGMIIAKPLFPLGQLYATPGAVEAYGIQDNKPPSS